MHKLGPLLLRGCKGLKKRGARRCEESRHRRHLSGGISPTKARDPWRGCSFACANASSPTDNVDRSPRRRGVHQVVTECYRLATRRSQAGSRGKRSCRWSVASSAKIAPPAKPADRCFGALPARQATESRAALPWRPHRWRIGAMRSRLFRRDESQRSPLPAALSSGPT
jgi:hypothetical protein